MPKGGRCQHHLESEGSEGGRSKNFKELADLGTEHFKKLYKAQEETSIAEIIKVARLFPCFVEEEEVGP
jgi:hypothetical protein